MLATDSTVTVDVHKGRVIRLPRPAATVFVADPEIADVQAQSASIVYLFGRRTGSTSLYAIDENDQLLLRTSVTVQHNLSGLRQAIGQIMPDARVTASTVDGSIVLDGLVDNPVQAQDLRELAERFLGDEETLLFRVRIASPTQVNLRVRVAEVSRDVLKEFGINWEAIFENGNFTFGFVSGRAVSDGVGNPATTSSTPRSTRSPRRAWSTCWPSRT
jgi:pilus assembly protein CpaC